jgi:hypothetical protein
MYVHFNNIKIPVLSGLTMSGGCVPSLLKLTMECLLEQTHPSVQPYVRNAFGPPLDLDGLGMACVMNKNRIESIPNTCGRVPPLDKENTRGFNDRNTPHALQLTTYERIRHNGGFLDAITKFTDDGKFRSNSFIQPSFWAEGWVPQEEYIAYPIEGRSGGGSSTLFATRVHSDCLRLCDGKHDSFWAEVHIPPVNKPSARGTKRARCQRG